MTIADIQIQRSLTNIPATLLFGEFAWSDSASNLYIGNSSGVPTLLNKITLQQAYNASINPEILTNGTLGALSLRRGSAADTDSVFKVQNNAGVNTFNITGAGTTSILKALPGTNLIVAPSIADPNIGTSPSTIYSQATTAGTDNAIRAYFNSGTAATSGYINLGYNGAGPYIQLLDMDDDPSFLDFSIARLGLANPGTFAAPAIINRFGCRGPLAAGTTGFSWLTNKGVSGNAITEFMSCDSNFLALPSIPTTDRPITPSSGMIEYNSTLGKIEAYENGAWTQYVDTTTTQSIAGNKIFTGKVVGNTNVQQLADSTLVTTVSNVFATITGMSLTTVNTIINKYRVSVMLNIRHSTTSLTTVEIKLRQNGIDVPNSLYNYNAQINTAPISISFDMIIFSLTPNVVVDVQWRRVSGTATVSVTNKSLIVQEIF
jgi:hypothetical protein